MTTRRNMWDRTQNTQEKHQDQRMREDRASRALRRRNLVDSPDIGGESDEEMMGPKRDRQTQLGLAGFLATPEQHNRGARSRHADVSQDQFIQPISIEDAASE